jgi:hypothetical protein
VPTYTIPWAGWTSTPEHTDILTTPECPIQLKQKIEENELSTKLDIDTEHHKIPLTLTSIFITRNAFILSLFYN